MGRDCDCRTAGFLFVAMGPFWKMGETSALVQTALFREWSRFIHCLLKREKLLFHRCQSFNIYGRNRFLQENNHFVRDGAAVIDDVAQIMKIRARGERPMAFVHSYGCQQNVADGEKIKGVLEANSAKPVVKWIEKDSENVKGKIVALPTVEDIDLPIEVHLIVELYSK